MSRVQELYGSQDREARAIRGEAVLRLQSISEVQRDSELRSRDSWEE